jgi:O-antigen/teichoic acid export membrane protein
MGIVVRQSIKIILITYSGFALGYLNTLIFYPLVLSKEEIGLVRILINATFLFATFASLGAANIPMRYFPYFKDHQKEHNGILFFILALGGVGYFLFVIVFLLFKPGIAGIYTQNAPMLIDYFYYFIPFTFVALFLNIFDSYLVIQQKPVVPNIVKEFLTKFLLTVGLILLLAEVLNFGSFVIYIILAYGLCLLILILYSRSLGILFIKPNLNVFKSSYLRSILVFGAYILMGNAAGTIIVNIDSLMLAAYSGLSAAGVYTIAFFIAAVIEIPKRTLSQSLIPIISEANKNEDMATLKMIYIKSSINQMILGGGLFLLIWSNIDNIFQVIPNGEEYIAGKWVVFWIGLGRLFDLLTGSNSEIVGTSKYYKMDLIFFSFLAAVGIGLNFIFIPRYGLLGAAFASALSMFLFNTVRYIFLLKVFRIQPFTFNTLKIFIIFLLLLASNYLLPVHPEFIIDLIYRSTILFAAFAGLTLALKVSEDFNKLAVNIYYRIKSKI